MFSNNSLFRDRNFVLFLMAIVVTKLGDKIYVFAIPWLIFELTQSSLGLGTMFLVQTLPFICISPIAGVIADRFPRKRILIICAWLQGILISFIPILYYTDLLQIWMIYILGFLIACSGACYSVINGTIIPQLFDKEVLIKVNSTFQFIDTSSVFFGSMVAGIFISIIGVYNLLIFNAVSFIIISIAVLFLTMKDDMYVKKGNTNTFKQLKDGGDFILRHPILGPFTLIILVVNIANGALVSMLVFFARNNLNLSSEELGFVYAGVAVAQVAVILLAPVLSKKRQTIKIMLVNLIISSIGIILVSMSWNWISLTIGMAIQSAPVIMFNVLNRTLRQMIVPNYIYGRVNGIITMLSLGTLPLSGFLTGVLAGFIEIKYMFLFLGLLSFIIAIKFSMSPLRNYDAEEYYSNELSNNNIKA